MSDAQSFVTVDRDLGTILQAHQHEIPATLYHYTDAAGLIGIISTKALWLTHFQYTNDSSEVSFGIHLAATHIEKIISASNDSPDYHLDDALRGKVSGVKPSDVLLQAALATLRTAAIDTASRYQFFFACFSEHQDQLSQWRAYSGNASGFSIGFTEDVLRNQAFLEELRRDKLGDTLDLLKVIYDEPTQTAILDELVSSARRHADDVMPTLPLEQRKNYIVDANVWFISSILRLALHFKHPGFQEEAEWRLILCKTSPDKAESETSNPVRTRLTGFGTTPYVTMPLCAHDEQLRLEHVIVGPKSQPIMFEGKSSYGLKILLRQLHGGGPARGISNSEIPYR